MTSEKKVAIFGAGYVGLTTAVLFANSGLQVSLVEVNPERLAKLKKGEPFFYEAGIAELLQAGLKSGNLTIHDDAKTALNGAGFVFSCVGTPDNPDGSSNLSYVFSVAESMVAHAKQAAIFIQKSTVPVGTGEKIEALFVKHKVPLDYVSNPEFLREGTAVEDSLWFDRVVVGGTSDTACRAVLGLYEQMERFRDDLTHTAQITPANRPEGTYIVTNRNSAELIKVTANAFLALKISFANSIALLAEQADANVNQIMDAVGADRRIGRAFFNAGHGYGGGCFPKDVSGLISSAVDYGVEMPIMNAAQQVNEAMPANIVEKIVEKVSSLEGLQVAVLGLSFKPGTSDVRRSPSIAIANLLQKYGATVVGYDPHANEEASHDLHQDITLVGSTDQAIRHANVVVVATGWPEFLALDFTKLSKAMHGSLVVDTMNSFQPETVRQAGLDYIGVGTV